MTDERKVECGVHGFQNETFVCQHLVESLCSNVFVGYHSSASGPDNDRSDAWCDNCEKKRIECGGDWTDESESVARVKLLCGACYDQTKKFNVRRKSWWKFWL